MTAPIAVDTPDYQRGVVSAQTLVGTMAANTGTVKVPVPPNAETLIVQGINLLGDIAVNVFGTTTLARYPWSTIYGGGSPAQWVTVFVDATSVLDGHVTINISPAPTATCYVYADSGVHIVSDPGKLTDRRAVQYVTPTVPNTAAGDHPPNELQVKSITNLATPATILPALGAGNRYRIFYATMNMADANVLSDLRDATPATPFLHGATGAAGTPTAASYLPSGIPLTANSAITGTCSVASHVTATIAYTTEAV